MNDASEQAGPLRVLHIGKYFPPHPGGMETYLRDLMNVQKRKGLEVAALVHGDKASIRDAELRVDSLGGGPYTVAASARWCNLGLVPFCPLFPFTATKAIKNFKPDVIHLHLPNFSPALLLLLKKARQIPWVCTWHSDVLTPIASPLMRFLYRLYQPLESLVLDRCYKIYATSIAYAEASYQLQQRQSILEVVPLGLDVVRLQKYNPPERPRKNKLHRFLTVGRLAHYKGILELIQTFRDIEGATLSIAGGGSLYPQARKLIKRLQLEQRVTLMGHVSEEELSTLYTNCDTFILASTDRTEAFGMVLLEASYYGAPIISRYIEGSGVPWVTEQLGGESVHSFDLKRTIRSRARHADREGASKSREMDNKEKRVFLALEPPSYK